jgi:DNA invertase Pin-like site-specific DNA recombinase
MAIYARVSTLDQDPAMQLRELRAYATHRRLPITAEFIDQVSGAATERPALAQLWTAVRARKVDAVLVWTSARILVKNSRITEHVHYLPVSSFVFTKLEISKHPKRTNRS